MDWVTGAMWKGQDNVVSGCIHQQAVRDNAEGGGEKRNENRDETALTS